MIRSSLTKTRVDLQSSRSRLNTDVEAKGFSVVRRVERPALDWGLWRKRQGQERRGATSRDAVDRCRPVQPPRPAGMQMHWMSYSVLDVMLGTSSLT